MTITTPLRLDDHISWTDPPGYIRQDVSKHIEKLGEKKQENQERFGSERPQGIFSTKAVNEIMGLKFQLLSLEKSPDSTD